MLQCLVRLFELLDQAVDPIDHACAKVGADLFSLIATCEALGVNPEAYLEDVLTRIDTTPASEIASLTPWAWAEAADTPSV